MQILDVTNRSFSRPQRLNINFLTARSFYYLCSPLIGVTLEVEGREHLEQLNSGAGGKSAVLVGNHQSFVVLGGIHHDHVELTISLHADSFLDILYLGRIFPKRAVIMAKKELRWAPLLGQYRQSLTARLALSLADFYPHQSRSLEPSWWTEQTLQTRSR
jgi:hypothetical protein